MKTRCLHCDPYQAHPQHLTEKMEQLLLFYQRIFFPIERLLKKFPQVHARLHRIIFYKVFKGLLAAGILREVDAFDDDGKIPNRTLVIIREARARNMTVKAITCFGKGTNFFSINVRGKKKIFEGLPCFELGYVLGIDFDDKYELKRLLQLNNLPYAKGEAFHDERHALRYVRELGFPVVVKPRCGSLSKHTTCNIQSDAALKEAIRIAKMISREFIVERFIAGDVYRVTLVNYRVVACCLREPPNVVGDGVHTLEELIAIKNADPLRGEVHQKNFTLHKMAVTEKTFSLLQAQHLNLESVAPAGKKVWLHDKVILAAGADIHDKTAQIHPENRMLFEKVANLCRSPLIGIDFICQDISKPYHNQSRAIIEANSLPYIDMHHYPVSGKPQNVAKHLLDYVTAHSKVEKI